MNNDKFQELRDKTFDYEDNQEHFVGSHFDAFFENMEEEVMMQIPDMLGKGVVVEPYYSNNEDMTDDEKWRKGYIMTYPKESLEEGIGLIIGVVEEENELQLISMFPHLNYGQKYELELSKVYVWDNGHEAHIEVDLGFTSLSFYDIYYDLNRKYYFQGKKYIFQILGIAYEAMYRVEKEIIVNMNHEETKRTISLVGMSSFIKIEGWDRDDYFFSGIVQKVKEIDIFISNEKGWICTTRVLRESEEDNIYDMDILVTKKTWKENDIPKIGDDIEGRVWMQGKIVL